TNVLEGDQSLWDSNTAHEVSIYIDRIQHHLLNINRDTNLFLQWHSFMENAPKQTLNANPESREIWEELQKLLHTIPSLEGSSEIFLRALKLNKQLRNHLNEYKDLQWSDGLATA